MAKDRSARVGAFCVAHEPYWAQFPGLRETLLRHHGAFCAMAAENGVEVVDFGMVDSNEAGFAAAQAIRAANLDLLFCNMTTYATSSVFAPIARDAGVPTVLVALQPASALDYAHANTFMQLENDSVCAVPEFMNAAPRVGGRVLDVVLGRLYGDARAKREIASWCAAAKALHALRGARLGLMGHALEAMYDMHADPTAISAAFGVHVPLLEVDDLVALRERVSEAETLEKAREIEAFFDTPEPGSDPLATKLTREDLLASAKTAAALDRLVTEYRLTGLAYYYGGRDDTPQRACMSSLIVGNSLLNARGVPMCGEFDIKTLVAMLVMDRLGVGGSFAEFHPFDFEDDIILVGHDGPHHLRIADGKPALRSLSKYHGKPGHGASVEFKLKEGPITLMGVAQGANGALRFIVGEGESVRGPIPPTGNTNTRARFEPDAVTFVKKWVMQAPTHHFALGVGHCAGEIQKVASALGIECALVR